MGDARMDSSPEKHGPARVLVVDDVQRANEVGRWIDAECHLITARTATEALELLARQPIDVVVSDDRAPGFDTEHFLSTVRRLHPDTVRLLFRDEDESHLSSTEAEVLRFLGDSWDPKELARSIVEAIEESEHRRADRMRRATRSGRKEALFDASLDRSLTGVFMAFQPILVSTDKRVFGYEALVRTTDDVISNPGALFGVAEELDRVPEVERLIHRRVSERINAAPPNATILVNVHPQSLEADFLYSPNGPLAKHASRIVLEITERSSLSELDALDRRVAALRALGFRIAVDDLGAGYAGLTSFAMLNPDIVKFDMSMIRDIHLSRTKQRVIGSMTTLCRELGIQTVAEGIESPEECETVCQLGCDLLQGFYFARPEAQFVVPEASREADKKPA